MSSLCDQRESKDLQLPFDTTTAGCPTYFTASATTDIYTRFPLPGMSTDPSTTGFPITIADSPSSTDW